MPRNNRGEFRVTAKLPQIPQRIVINAQSMFKPRMCGTRINMRCEGQLCHLPQALELRRINNGTDTARKRHVLFGRNSDHSERITGLCEF